MENANIKTAGLIDRRDLAISVGTKKIHIYAGTKGSDFMNIIGITNIHIQRSSNNLTWTDEKTASSDYAYNSDYYKNSDYEISVLGGYYYRVVLDHYANNGSMSESISNTSNSVWIA